MKPIQFLAAVAAIVVVAGSLPPATPVSAHAAYDSSTPSVGERLAVGPSQVEITFTQDIQKLAGSYGIEVQKDRGLDVTAGPSVVNDNDRTKLSVPLQPGLLAGRYVVNWKNVSDEDGDPKEGAFSFYVGDYEPNTVDLANDAQLEEIGAEGDPTPTAAVVNTEPAGDTTPAATAVPSITEAATATVPGTNDDPPPTADDGDSNNTTVIIIIAGLVALVAVAIGAYVVTRRGS
jgi:methionine-rich copper-binding protein CopC